MTATVRALFNLIERPASTRASSVRNSIGLGLHPIARKNKIWRYDACKCGAQREPGVP